MKRNLNRLMPILLAGMFVYGGCAKQDVVKKDASLASSVTKPAETATSTPAASRPGNRDEPIAATAANASPLDNGEQARPQPPKEPTATPGVARGLDRIYFDFDASTLSAAARQTLTGNFETLKQNPASKLRIEGHCDERGSDDYNLALSESRARAAQRYLTALGIPAERLSTIGYGKEKPADPGHDEKAWAGNRRDEFVIIE
ncbi:MAG: hypothetical protein A2075_17710 [Geobacteraceae bacterium GWC2_58_44]|nr:MAG: hypothetical protein A2075_17710 [Geobacteraceae bacterium GWC2_58_44]HBG04328.1 cell envelope biogenesis protein OmpA [Geobacter sp.]